jgi:secondary thiamine-phosphate synthase enzyme
MLKQTSFELRTPGRGAIEITDTIQRVVEEVGVESGLAHVFIHHTSASLMVCENADSMVLDDLERFMARLVPDGDRLFKHSAEGPDDMPAHVRSVLTQVDLQIPVRNGRCDLGTWQGIYLYEHRHNPHTRRLTVSVQGVDR